MTVKLFLPAGLTICNGGSIVVRHARTPGCPGHLVARPKASVRGGRAAGRSEPPAPGMHPSTGLEASVVEPAGTTASH